MLNEDLEQLAPYPWQLSHWNKLRQRFNDNRMPHALLLSGPNGMGKHYFALYLAKFILCEQRENDSPCEECQSCRLVKSFIHPDLVYIKPEGVSHGIGIEKIRDINESVHKTTLRGDFFITIINPAESMTMAASNALLKTLEEPPEKSLFILVTEQMTALPATIRSRCHKISFQAIQADHKEYLVTKDWLIDLLGKDGECERSFLMSEGAPLLAVEISRGDRLMERERWYRYMSDLVHHKQNPVALTEFCMQEDPQEVLKDLIALVKDMIMYKSSKDKKVVEDKRIASIVVDLCENVYLQTLFKRLDRLLAASDQLRYHSSVNTQLLLENLFIEWYKGN